ncbi:hypothetical protein [Sphingomonas sp.]|uniref:hypothetical protein n=1 Tax=Sphingomonas sp. TaxID=28214 RepID=UPI002DD6B2B7|nr:hypothetical protein [Sphingomonas sp.]
MADRIVFAVLVGATALPQIAADLSADETAINLTALVLSFVQIYVNLLVTFRALDHGGGAPPGYVRADLTEGRYAGAFALGFASVAAILGGLILLIVPGVLLMLLWSVSLPALAAERIGAIDALRRSWRLARPALRPLALTLLPIVLAWLAIFAGVAVMFCRPQMIDVISGVLNVAMSALLPFSAAVWAFAYLELRDAGSA